LLEIIAEAPIIEGCCGAFKQQFPPIIEGCCGAFKH